MDGFRIRVGDVEISVPDVDGLVRLAERGKLRRKDQVRTTSGWMDAEEVSELKEKFNADPWDAWADVDSFDAASMYKQMTERGEEPEDLPAEAMAPVHDAPLRARPTAPLPEVEPDAVTEEGGGEIIDFPARPPEVPKYDRVVRPRKPAAAPDTQPLVRMTRVVTYVVVGVLVLLLGYGWIRVNGSSPPGVDPLRAPAPESKALPAPDSISIGLIKLEAELRGLLPAEPRIVSKPGDLGDALTIEMSQLGVKVVAVDARVTKWVGRRQDEAKTAEIRITFLSSGDLARDMGGMAMVIGRYKRMYRMDVPVLVVTEQTTGGKTTLDPEKVEQLYQGRMPLGKFLSEIGR